MRGGKGSSHPKLAKEGEATISMNYREKKEGHLSEKRKPCSRKKNEGDDLKKGEKSLRRVKRELLKPRPRTKRKGRSLEAIRLQLSFL